MINLSMKRCLMKYNLYKYQTFNIDWYERFRIKDY